MKKFTKLQANYRPGETKDFVCGNCIHFLPHDKTKQYGRCGIVEGRVSSAGVCDLWEPNPEMEPGDLVYEMRERYKEHLIGRRLKQYGK